MGPDARNFIICSVIFNLALVVLIWAFVIRKFKKKGGKTKEAEDRSGEGKMGRRLLEYMEGLSEELNRVVAESDPGEKKRFFVRPDTRAILFVFKDGTEADKTDVPAIAEVIIDPRAIYCIFRYDHHYESIAGYGPEGNALKALGRMRVNLLDFVETYHRAS